MSVGEMELERNPGKLSTGGFVEAEDAEGVWRTAAYWARKDRGVRLRNAQQIVGDGEWIEIRGFTRKDPISYKFVVRSVDGTPWIAALIGKHGLYSTYVNWECRCPPCCGAHEEYGSDYRAGITGE